MSDIPYKPLIGYPIDNDKKLFLCVHLSYSHIVVSGAFKQQRLYISEGQTAGQLHDDLLITKSFTHLHCEKMQRFDLDIAVGVRATITK